MGKSVRFGVLTIQNLPWEKEVERWKLIERLGFDSVWIADHFTDPVNPTGHWFESWTLLASLAVITEKIRIGTLVSSIPLRNPAILARQALTIDHISNGRLELGIGTGVPGNIDPVYKMIGIENWSGKERVNRFKEQIEMIDSLLCQSVSSYKGKFYNLNEAAMNPPTIQKPRPPLTIAAMGNSMLKIAAQYADTWNTHGASEWDTPVDKIINNVRIRATLIDKYCEEIGRDPETLNRSILFYSRFGRNILNTKENFRKIVQQYKEEIGINEFIIYFPFFDSKQIQNITSLANDVIPNLR